MGVAKGILKASWEGVWGIRGNDVCIDTEGSFLVRDSREGADKEGIIRSARREGGVMRRGAGEHGSQHWGDRSNASREQRIALTKKLGAEKEQ